MIFPSRSRNSLGFGMVLKVSYRPKGMLGASHPMAKLTDPQVRDIRQSQDLHSVIAARHKVDPSRVWRIKAGKSWCV